MTPTEHFTDKFKVIERESDDLGRVLGFRRLRLSERTKLDEWFPALNERGAVFITASCCEIDDVKVPFCRNRAELESFMDRLEEPGVAAGTVAVSRIYGISAAKDGEAESETDQAKK